MAKAREKQTPNNSHNFKKGTNVMLAFNNDPALKKMVLKQVNQHEKADEIIQGQYWEKGKGCFIGCVAHSNSTDTFANLTGFPLMLTRIAENIFESLPNDIAKTFPAKILAAPRPGADLSLVAWKFLHWGVTDTLEKCRSPKTQRACTAAVLVLAHKAQGIDVPPTAARAASAAADADYAVAAAARAAAYAAYAAEAAHAAAHAAADAHAEAARTDAAAARAAAHAAAHAASASTAIYETRHAQMDKLIEILASA